MIPRENFMQWIPPGKREAAEAYFDELEGRLRRLESGIFGAKTATPSVAPVLTSLGAKPPAK